MRELTIEYKMQIAAVFERNDCLGLARQCRDLSELEERVAELERDTISLFYNWIPADYRAMLRSE